MKTIAVTVCFFGKKFPWYFDFFVHSCKFNPSVDFIIFTDIKNYQRTIPPNIKFVYLTFAEINDLASEKLGFHVDIKHPYKLCDFKPAYGLIFSDYLQGYDYWAQSDIDIIFGNIRDFLDHEKLSSYDFISIRHDYTTGCFALYKNNDLMNNMFKRSKDYKMVLSTSRHFCFDECNFKHDALTAGQSIFEVETEVETFTHIIRLAESKGEINAHFDFILLEGIPGRIKFADGRIIYKKKYEGILYHLYWLKSVYNPTKVSNRIPDNYSISTNRIYY
jgi:hypothetical protein